MNKPHRISIDTIAPQGLHDFPARLLQGAPAPHPKHGDRREEDTRRFDASLPYGGGWVRSEQFRRYTVLSTKGETLTTTPSWLIAISTATNAGEGTQILDFDAPHTEWAVVEGKIKVVVDESATGCES